ncbi:MAG: ribosomal protein S18-alanine N-acetyltransferase [Litorivicinaceae bacterium]
MRVQPEALHFRLMQPADFDAVCALEQAAYSHPWSRAIVGGCTEVGYRIWLGELDGQHICQGFLSVAAGEAHILNLAVDPRFQNRGIGAVLLQHVIEDARAQGAAQLFLEVRASNGAAQRLYDRAGFNELGRRRNYYPTASGREDAMVYGLQLRFDQI